MSFEEQLAQNAEPEQRLVARIKDNYEEFLQELESPSFLPPLALAAEVTATKQVYDELSVEGSWDEYAHYLLQFPNPLEVVRDIWISYNNVDIHEELEHALFTEMERDLAEEEEETCAAPEHEPKL